MKILEVDYDPIDLQRYQDYFDYIDNRFSVMVFNKVWKNFPTHDQAKSAADNYNRKHKRIIAHVVEN